MDPGPILAVLLGLAGAWLLFVVVLGLLRPRDRHLVDLVRMVPAIVRLCRDVTTHPRAPVTVRMAIAGLLVYLLRPIDLIPQGSSRS